MPLVSISDHQRTPLPPVNWMGTVYHGLPEGLLHEGKGEGGYLAFLGRICADKGILPAIEIARRAGHVLKVAAKVDPADRKYFEEEVKPVLAQSPHVEFIGEINDGQKQEFLGKARALLFPDLLAGAFRPGDDRGDGLRHAGCRLQQRLGAGSDGRWPDRLCGR